MLTNSVYSDRKLIWEDPDLAFSFLALLKELRFTDRIEIKEFNTGKENGSPLRQAVVSRSQASEFENWAIANKKVKIVPCRTAS